VRPTASKANLFCRLVDNVEAERQCVIVRYTNYMYSRASVRHIGALSALSWRCIFRRPFAWFQRQPGYKCFVFGRHRSQLIVAVAISRLQMSRDRCLTTYNMTRRRAFSASAGGRAARRLVVVA